MTTAFVHFRLGDGPVWRQAFDQVDRRLSPLASALTHTGWFADVTGFALSATAGLERRRRELLRRSWHAWNLPAGSDVERLTRRVVELEWRLRDLGNGGGTSGRRGSAEPGQA